MSKRQTRDVQTSMPVLIRHEGYCEKALCPKRGRAVATHVVTVDGWEFKACGPCARPWESSRDAKVERITAEVKP